MKAITPQWFSTAFLGSPGTHFDSLTFSDRRPKMSFKYVAWVDVMGASHLMERAPDAAARSIGRLHEAAFRSLERKTAGKVDIDVFQLSDGMYLVSDNFDGIVETLNRMFRSYAHSFASASINGRWLPLRAAIAYGRVSDSSGILDRSVKSLGPGGCKRFRKLFPFVIHGTALSDAYKAEGFAPPFGIVLHESVRKFGTTSGGAPTTWELEKWWLVDKTEEGRKRGAEFAKSFGSLVRAYFDWAERNPYDSGLSAEKAASYKKRIDACFGLDACSDVPGAVYENV